MQKQSKCRRPVYQQFPFLLVCFGLLFIGGSAFSQKTYCFRVYLRDKHHTAFSLDHPGQFLSQRAIDRRTKYHISIDSTDLPVNTFYTDSILKVTGGILKLRSKWHNTIVIALSDSPKINLLQGLSFVQKAKLVAVFTGNKRRKAPLPPLIPMGGNDAGFYGNAWDQIHLCNGEYLHRQGNMGSGMLIAVLDVGFPGINTLAAFDSLRADNRLKDRWNFVEDTTTLDGLEHGTMVLSCMAAYLPGQFVGTAPKAAYALYVTDDATTEQTIEEDNWTAAAERADSIGADLISSSLGYNQFDQPANSYTYADLDGQSTYLDQTVNEAVRKGIMAVISAGNEGKTSWHYILTPGDADSAFTIGSVDVQKIPAPTSSWGPNAAGKRKPEVVALGQGAAVVGGSGDITTNNGTSFATPVIAGLTACLMQSRPDLKPMNIKAYISSVSDHFSNPDDKRGYGIPDFKAAYQLITGINEQAGDLNQVLVYPNPARNDVFIQFSQFSSMPSFTLTDQLGRKIKVKLEAYLSPTLYKLSMTGLAPGIYYLTIKNGGRYTVKKLVLK